MLRTELGAAKVQCIVGRVQGEGLAGVVTRPDLTLASDKATEEPEAG